MNHETQTIANTAPTHWLGRDGMPVTDAEKIRELNANFDHIRSQLQQVLVDAVQMGVSENFVRIVLTDMVASMERPNHNPVTHN
jgi:hypothetical protein